MYTINTPRKRSAREKKHILRFLLAITSPFQEIYRRFLAALRCVVFSKIYIWNYVMWSLPSETYQMHTKLLRKKVLTTLKGCLGHHETKLNDIEDHPNLREHKVNPYSHKYIRIIRYSFFYELTSQVQIFLHPIYL